MIWQKENHSNVENGDNTKNTFIFGLSFPIDGHGLDFLKIHFYFILETSNWYEETEWTFYNCDLWSNIFALKSTAFQDMEFKFGFSLQSTPKEI